MLCTTTGRGCTFPAAKDADSSSMHEWMACCGRKSNASRELCTSGRSCANRAGLQISLLEISKNRPPSFKPARDPATIPGLVKVFSTASTPPFVASSVTNINLVMLALARGTGLILFRAPLGWGMRLKAVGAETALLGRSLGTIAVLAFISLPNTSVMAPGAQRTQRHLEVASSWEEASIMDLMLPEKGQCRLLQTASKRSPARRCSRLVTAMVRDTTPAAGSVCPKKPLLAMRVTGLPDELLPKTVVAAPTSMGSPSGVPSLDVTRLQVRSLQGLSDDALLGGAIGSSQAAAAPILEGAESGSSGHLRNSLQIPPVQGNLTHTVNWGQAMQTVARLIADCVHHQDKVSDGVDGGVVKNKRERTDARADMPWEGAMRGIPMRAMREAVLALASTMPPPAHHLSQSGRGRNCSRGEGSGIERRGSGTDPRLVPFQELKPHGDSLLPDGALAAASGGARPSYSRLQVTGYRLQLTGYRLQQVPAKMKQGLNLAGLQVRSLQGLFDDTLLGGAIGGSQAAAAPILRPSALSMPAFWNAAGVSGEIMTFTPLLQAALHWPSIKLLKAMCRLTKEEEQAVSTVSEGPLRAKVYDSLPEITLAARPVAV
ncbi:MAG: hypothetical protein FRX49_03596 [Trebouxia sp. A1-2]|nr:MAG: hypothetical protein FRX49_03596 [Trebouxia sp. A1-2]